MKIKVYFFILSCLFLQLSFAQNKDNGKVQYTLTLSSEGKLKDSGDIFGKIISLVPAGTKVGVYLKDNNYYKIEYNGLIGFISEIYFGKDTIPQYPLKIEDVEYCVTLSSEGKLKDKGGVFGEIIDEIPKGSKVAVYGYKDGYYHVHYKNKTGFLSEIYIDKDSKSPYLKDEMPLTQGNTSMEFVRKETLASKDFGNKTGCVYGNCSDGYGIYIWSSGEKYEGYWKNKKRNGEGINYYASGAYYKGDWIEGFKHGYGYYKYKEESAYETYTGDYHFNDLEGKGTLTWKSGKKYVGEFRDNKFNGQGTMYYTDGTKQSGKWINDFFYGNNY